MAIRYWVSGTGTWDATNTANWSTTSGGTGGASVPTSADSARFDANSGGVGTQVTCNTSTNIQSLIFTGFVREFIHNSAVVITISGSASSLDMNSGMTYTKSNDSTINITNVNFILRSKGFSFGTLNLTSNYIRIEDNNPSFYAINITAPSTGFTFYVLQTGLSTQFLTVIGAASKTAQCILQGNTFAVTDTLTLSGNSATNRLLLNAITLGTRITITNTGATVTASNVDFRDIGLSTATDLSAITGGSGDCLGNSGIIFTTSATQNWTNTSGGNWDAVANWSGRVPLPQDDVTFNCVFNSTSTVSTNGMPRLGRSIDFTSATWSGTALRFTLATASIGVFGSFIYKTGMLHTHSSMYSISFFGRGDYTFTPAGVTQYIIATQAIGGYVRLNGNLTATNVTVNYGTFDCTNNGAGNYNLTLSTLASSNSNTRALIFGTGTHTFSGVGGIIDVTVGTNLTVSAASATFEFASATSNLTPNLNTFMWGNIRITPGTGTCTFSGAFTFANMSMTGAGTKTVSFTSGQVYTMTGTNFLSGTSGNNITVKSSTTGGTNTNFTISKSSGIVSSDYLTMNDSTATGGASFYTGANSTLTDCPGWINTVPPSGNALFFGRGF